MTIVEFLNARYDEGTQVALRIIQTRPDGLLVRPVPGSGQLWSVTGEGLLRDIEAKRAIVGLHVCPCPADCGECGECSGAHHADPTPAPCDTLRHLAAVYVDHPDHNPEWAPEPA